MDTLIRLLAGAAVVGGAMFFLHPKERKLSKYLFYFAIFSAVFLGLVWAGNQFFD
jgi:hypothetical protein